VVRPRAAWSRELVAKGPTPSGCRARTPDQQERALPDAERPPKTLRRAVVDPVDRRGRPRKPDRRHPDGGGAGEPRARPSDQLQTRTAGDARAAAAAAASAASPAASAGLFRVERLDQLVGLDDWYAFVYIDPRCAAIKRLQQVIAANYILEPLGVQTSNGGEPSGELDVFCTLDCARTELVGA